MLNPSGRALAVIAASAAATFLVPLSAHATPLDACDADGLCTARLGSVTADVVDGTLTGTPIGATDPITLAGQEDAYLTSVGFPDPHPDAVQEWDESIEQVSGLRTDPDEPNWYGNAKAKVFLPRALNEIATRFPPDTLLVRYVADDSRPGTFQLVTIQPTPPDGHFG